jgi:hypothetical protein
MIGMTGRRRSTTGGPPPLVDARLALLSGEVGIIHLCTDVGDARFGERVH